MKKRTAILSGVAGVMAAGLLCWWFLSPTEPRYEGKTVSYWLQHPRVLSNSVSIGPMLSDIGIGLSFPKFYTNALPILITAMDREDGSLKKFWIRVWPKLPGWMRSRIPQPTSAVLIQLDAMIAFASIGERDVSAIPALVRISRNSQHRLSRFFAVQLLLAIDASDPRVKQAVADTATDQTVSGLINKTPQPYKPVEH